jgi:argininosuccinate synthase
MPGPIVLAFSGGLDTSYCVPHLIEQGHEVVTLFVDTGGVTDAVRRSIHDRAIELGAKQHITHDASHQLWDQFVTPFVMGGVPYQDQYPLLCSDRYAIASGAAALGEEIGASAIAHGCTAMGNDQVRFDHTLRMLSPLPIIAPIRELQAVSDAPREYEIEYLTQRGFDVATDVKRYTMNENLLGATISGSEIDRFEKPSEDARVLTAPASEWPGASIQISLGFECGACVAIDGKNTPGPELLNALNSRLGAIGVGRSIYTGDTIIGLKGRIVFEAPGLTALLAAHRALEEITLTKEQNQCKPGVARKWTDLVYSGFYYEPLRADLEAMIRSTQQNVSGEVTIEAFAGSCGAVCVAAKNPLIDPKAVYAQHAGWSAADAEGFIKLLGTSSAMAAASIEPKQQVHAL